MAVLEAARPDDALAALLALRTERQEYAAKKNAPEAVEVFAPTSEAARRSATLLEVRRPSS